MTPDALKARREALGLNMTDMASYLGVSFNTYRNWEVGRRRMRKSTAILTDHALTLAEDAHRNGLPLPDWQELLNSFTGRVF